MVSQSLITDGRLVDSDINDEYWGSDHCPLSLVIKSGEGAINGGID